MGFSRRKRGMVNIHQSFKQGDIIYIDCDPQAGHEQKGRRPALVVTNSIFNRLRGGMTAVCPITNTNRSDPLHIPVTGCKTTGYVMTDQPKMLDISARNGQFFDTVPQDVLTNVLDILSEIFEPEVT